MRGLTDRLDHLLGLPIVPGARTRMGDLPVIAWFAAISTYVWLGAFINWSFGWDATIYTNAARALLSSGDPWGLVDPAGKFAGPPPSLLPYLPFTWLPDPVVAVGWMAVAALCAIYILRRLHLPAWWLLFPPLTVAILTGGTALPVTALLVRGGALAEGAAIAFRAYAAVPLAVLGRWRAFVVALAILIVTWPFLDWPRFLGDVAGINATFIEQTKGGQSAASVPWLIPVAVVCLLLLGRRRAAWLLVPALWPYTQGYYGVIAMPVVAEAPFVALAMAANNLPGIFPGLIVAGLVAQVVAEGLRSPAEARNLRALGWRP
jgi:hypothetical protein